MASMDSTNPPGATRPTAIARSPAAKLLYVAVLLAAAGGVYWKVRARREQAPPPPPIDFAETGGTVNELLQVRAAWDGRGDPPFPHLDEAERVWRYQLPREVANLFFYCDRKGEEYDPWTGVRRAGGLDRKYKWPEHPQKRWWVRTNSDGMRNAAEVRSDRPELRILATGDSHTDGVCMNEEAWPLVLRERLLELSPELDVESLNAGKGGFGFYNYLGVIEKHAHLAPDVFVVCVYGGNDFEGVLGLWHYFERTVRPMGTWLYAEEVLAAREISAPAMAQAFLSVKYFATQPDQEPVALAAALGVSREIVARCRELDCLPVFVYLPSLPDVRYDEARELCDQLLAAMNLDRGALDVHRRLADAWIAGLRADGVDVVDLRAPFAAAEGPLYWRRDHHINVAAQALVAEALAPLVAERL